jgi:hypothetical protein
MCPSDWLPWFEVRGTEYSSSSWDRGLGGKGAIGASVHAIRIEEEIRRIESVNTNAACS